MAVSLLVVLALLAINIAHQPREPLELTKVGWSTNVLGCLAIEMANHTARPIYYDICLERKSGHSWTPTWQPQSTSRKTVFGTSVSSRQSVTPFRPWQGVTIIGRTGTLIGKGQTATELVERPMHITETYPTTAWRVRIVWSYAEPSRWEAFRTEAIVFFTRKHPGFKSSNHTNYTKEIKY